MKNISASELNQELSKNNSEKTILIDVRTPAEFSKSQIAGAINIPINNIQTHVLDLKSYDKVFVYCQSGARSFVAGQLLQVFGVKNIFNLSGGISEWSRAGLE